MYMIIMHSFIPFHGFYNLGNCHEDKEKSSMRSHPLFVRWCLNLSRISPKAYKVMKDSRVQLPTRRTLNDYTHWVTMKPGFSHEIDTFLSTEAKVNEFVEWKR